MTWMPVPGAPGFERDVTPEPVRPVGYASSDDIAAKQTAKAHARLREAGASDAELADARRRLVNR
jgi:hypothetical protein